MANVTTSLFPQFMGLLSGTPEESQAARVRAAYAPVDPMQGVAGIIRGRSEMMGQNIGRAFGQEPVEDVQKRKLQAIVQSAQQEADLATPEGLTKLAEKMNQFPEFSGIALALRQQAAQQAQEGQLKQAQTAKALAEADKAMRGEGPKFANEVDRALYQDFLAQSNGNAGEAARKFSEYKSSLRQKEAKAGVPESGAVKIQDIAAANKIVTDLTAKPKAKLEDVTGVRTQLDLVKKGTGSALPQLQRALVRLVGDNQIAFNETKAVLGSAGIVGDTINALEQFLTGTPTMDKLNSVEKVVDALEEINASSYNRGRERAAIVVNEAALSEQTKKALLPPKYETGAEKAKKGKKGSFVEGRVYVDAKGNRARYVNGQWQPVQ